MSREMTDIDNVKLNELWTQLGVLIPQYLERVRCIDESRPEHDTHDLRFSVADYLLTVSEENNVLDNIGTELRQTLEAIVYEVYGAERLFPTNVVPLRR
jgi:hypothetical protein